MPNPTAVLGPSASLPANPLTTVVSPPGGIYTMSVTGTDIYVVNGNGVYTYTLSGAPVAHFSLPGVITTNTFSGLPVGSDGISQPVIDSSGNIYLASYYGGSVVAFSPTGAVEWTVRPSGLPDNIFSAISPSGAFELGVTTTSSSANSVLYNSAGSQVGTVSLVEGFSAYVTHDPNGDIRVSTGTGYVQLWDRTANTMLSEFGSSLSGGYTGAPYGFFYQGQAVLGSDGNVYTADGLSTIEETSPNGLLIGTTSLGGALSGNQSVAGGMFQVGGDLYLQTSGAFDSTSGAVSKVSVAVVDQYVSSPQASLNALGWGAGLAASQQGNYFARGTTPAVHAVFDPWWSELGSQMKLSYSVWSEQDIATGSAPNPTVISLPSSPSALSSVPLSIPSADTLPGPYEVEAELVDTSTSQTVGATCLPYTVGATGDRLDLSTLPSGIGGGGPTDVRGVTLNSQLGLTGYRPNSTIDWSTFLPNCNGSAPTAGTCGPSAMNFSSAPISYYQAAYAANQTGVRYWVQVSGGDSVSNALVSNGWWQADTQLLAAHYASVPSGCSGCAPVTAWEPWNEANNTGWGDASAYVSQVLAPFYRAVKAAGSNLTVIGGSSLGVPLSWWSSLVAAGGLSYMDVASVHPYTGSNDLWEEDGIPGTIRSLQAMIGPTPLWLTEVGWWSDGPYNYTSQASAVAHAMVWQKVLGIPVWNYFYDEGSWGNNGVSFSLIQTSSRGDDYVKPAALASMEASTELTGQAYQSMPQTGIPSTYEAVFGPTSTGPSDRVALWTDGFATTGALSVSAPGGGTVPVTVTDQYGRSSQYSLVAGTAYAFPVSSNLSYVSYPQGDSVSFGPAVGYGSDLALSSAGATATASSGNATAALIDPESVTGYGVGWSSATGDTIPSLTVTLASTTTINRVVVDTQSVGSVASGVRDYTVDVETAPGTWQNAASVSGAFGDHVIESDFAPVRAMAVRVTVTAVNFGGYYGGGIPPWWGAGSPQGAFLHAVEVYSGTSSPAEDQGASLPALGQASGGSGSGPTTTTTVLPVTTTTTVPVTTTTVPPVTTTTTIAPPTTVPPTTPPPGDRGRQVGASGAGPASQGYRLAASSGAAYSFGDEGSYGGVSNLARPVVGMASTPDGQGYWLVASDGGIFAFGDARFYGSTGGVPLVRPIVGMASTPDGQGYWLVASDGGIFTFGDASFLGSASSQTSAGSVVGMG
ncbi:MAG: discoidin domain-containing protein [Acidobacteriota bacterium]|nr:discoidin domain-containing protein [Acidobacteriota bacterium]